MTHNHHLVHAKVLVFLVLLLVDLLSSGASLLHACPEHPRSGHHFDMLSSTLGVTFPEGTVINSSSLIAASVSQQSHMVSTLKQHHYRLFAGAEYCSPCRAPGEAFPNATGA